MEVTAKWKGVCAESGVPYPAGTRIEKIGDKRWRIADPEERRRLVQTQGVIQLETGSGYERANPWPEGSVVRVYTDDHTEKRASTPGYKRLTARRVSFVAKVVSSSDHWVVEDGLSMGAGEPDGYIYRATARPATKLEANRLLLSEERTRQARGIAGDIGVLVEEIKKSPVVAQRSSWPLGPRFDRVDEFAPEVPAAAWLVLSPDGSTWYIENQPDGVISSKLDGLPNAVGWCTTDSQLRELLVHKLLSDVNEQWVMHNPEERYAVVEELPELSDEVLTR